MLTTTKWSHSGSADGIRDLPDSPGELAYLDVLFGAVLPDLVRVALRFDSGLALRQDVHVHIDNRRPGHNLIVRVDRPGTAPSAALFSRGRHMVDPSKVMSGAVGHITTPPLGLNTQPA